MKGINRKNGVTTGLIITALIASIIIFVMLLYTEKKALATEEKSSVCVAMCEIPAGTDINAVTVKQYFEIRDMYVSVIPQNAITDFNLLIGKNTYINISPGMITTYEMFKKSDIGSSGMEEPVLLGFKVDDIYQVAGGILREGDRIDIYTVDDEGDAKLRWENIYIEDVFDSAGEELDKTDEGRAIRFNIYLEKDDVGKFYSNLESGNIRVVKK